MESEEYNEQDKSLEQTQTAEQASIEQKPIEENRPTQEDLPTQQDQPESLTKSILSSIIYPIILMGISVLFYVNGQTSLAGLIIAIILSVVSGVLMFIGGFYLIIVPLPIIYLFSGGCSRKNLPMGKKVILGVSVVVSIILMFVAMFVLQP